MDTMRKSLTGTARWPGRRRAGGFASLEAGYAVLVALLGFGLVLMLAGRIRQRRNCDNYIKDLRVFAAAFEHSHQQRSTWPPSTHAEAALPPELADALKDTRWLKGSPFGGNYAWVAPDPASAGDNSPRGWGDRGAVTLTAFSPGRPLAVSNSDLLYVDRELDDGDLATGRFRTGFNGWPIFLVEAAKR